MFLHPVLFNYIFQRNMVIISECTRGQWLYSKWKKLLDFNDQRLAYHIGFEANRYYTEELPWIVFFCCLVTAILQILLPFSNLWHIFSGVRGLSVWVCLRERVAEHDTWVARCVGETEFRVGACRATGPWVTDPRHTPSHRKWSWWWWLLPVSRDSDRPFSWAGACHVFVPALNKVCDADFSAHILKISHLEINLQSPVGILIIFANRSG